MAFRLRCLVADAIMCVGLCCLHCGAEGAEGPSAAEVTLVGGAGVLCGRQQG
jgi:hypothetical protein